MNLILPSLNGPLFEQLRQGELAMTGSSYLELLRLTAPEIVVALAGLLVLVLDLSFLRRTSLALRFRGAVAASAIGCAVALGVLERLPCARQLAGWDAGGQPANAAGADGAPGADDFGPSPGELRAFHHATWASIAR